ncbi:hypothetical protein [Psychrosphaera algicola]|uniref:Uncharacterized protein n=1 Tax=Psychrosphaera algicola TaxID=3023714 RepID=A0ABT5FIK6_9GAMM|nr:hypothetical protein [Psychrosphaera sp. G1-22]MDC2891035.1 hypothetical protein [Psychrosphaera sp. G1-22]
MESTIEPSFVSENAKTAETKEKYVSQYELIKQWRVNLTYLKKDKGFKVPKELDKSDKKVNTALDAIAYLEQKIHY